VQVQWKLACEFLPFLRLGEWHVSWCSFRMLTSREWHTQQPGGEGTGALQRTWVLFYSLNDMNSLRRNTCVFSTQCPPSTQHCGIWEPQQKLLKENTEHLYCFTGTNRIDVCLSRCSVLPSHAFCFSSWVQSDGEFPQLSKVVLRSSCLEVFELWWIVTAFWSRKQLISECSTINNSHLPPSPSLYWSWKWYHLGPVISLTGSLTSLISL
jgi:hypothetical protein